jgi:hypothetical protein
MSKEALKMRRFLSALFLLFFIPAWVMAKDQPIGSVKTLEGDVSVQRDEQKLSAAIGMTLFQGDIVETSTSGTVGIIFRDDSIISLGPESKLDMKEYVFEPKDEKFSLLMKMVKGTFVYISGAIGRLSPDSVKLETPSSMIGTRGTKILIEVKA